MNIRTMIASTLLLTSVTSFSMDKVVYGEDNRLDIFEVTNPMHLELARSTAAMVSSYKLQTQNNGDFKLTGGTLNVCEGEKFDGQLTSASCSGFLVDFKGKEYLVTAGHCISSQSACEGQKWVFDYRMDHADQTEHIVSSDNVYSCKTLVDRKLTRGDQNDYAVIELDRKVVGRTPLTIRTEGVIDVNQEILVIGHPSGLPSKVADGAFVREIKGTHFETNLDTFAGNSGSAVFNAESGTVEGILVRGHTDYRWTRVNGKSCKMPVYCEMGSCRGEDVTKITAIDFFQD